MVNERKTEKLVRDLLEENGYAHKNNIVIEEQASDNPKIDKLLQTETTKSFGLGRNANQNSINRIPQFKTYSFDQFMKQLN